MPKHSQSCETDLRKLQHSQRGSWWKTTVIFYRSTPLPGKAGLGPGSRDFSSLCRSMGIVAWQCHGGGCHSLGQAPLEHSGVVLSSIHTGKQTRQMSLLFCSKSKETLNNGIIE